MNTRSFYFKYYSNLIALEGDILEIIIEGIISISIHKTKVPRLTARI